MAFDLVAAYAQADAPFFVMGQSPQVLMDAPQQITLRFSPGAKIDPSSLAGSIVVQRSGGAGDGFGLAGSKTDVTIAPGSITVDDLPNQNQVVIRFAETPVDDTYRLTINSGLKTLAQGGSPADSFGHAGGSSYSFDFRIDLGAFVVAVVPQPVTRQLSGSLTQARGDIDVYFNTEDPLQRASAETVGFYRLFQVDPATNADIGAAIGPTSVAYDAATGRARLSFGASLENAAGLYRLEIGGNPAPVPVVFSAGDDNNSSFTTARVLGQLTPNGVQINASIDPRPTVTTPVGTLGFPSQPGTLDSPGHRDVPIDSGAHGTPSFAVVDPVSGLATVPYNFRSVIGQDPQGNDLQNVITEAQKQRAREIFELFSLYSGVRFVETANQGLMVATGDLRAFDPSIPAGAVAGLGGGSGALMNSLINWGNSEYGGSWFQVAMHEIGHALGLGHTYDLPSIMGADLGGEAVFPGDYDIEHLRQLYPANGSDIDVYRFTLAESGRFSAETVVARPGQPITSYLDSVISLYREDLVNGRTVRTLVARNDDYYGRDSFVGLDLEAGTYFVAVTSTGNTAFDPAISDSGANGRTEGDYRLDLRFTPASAAANTIVDLTARPIDGDRDGVAGGGFKFWFNAAAQADTIHVDKSSTQAGGGDGSLANPFKTIQAALAAVQPTTKIVRVAGTAAVPYQIGTNLAGSALADGATFNVPQGVTVMIDGGAVFKLRATNIDVGSSTQLVSRGRAAIQVLGVPATGSFAGSQVTFTSWHDDSIGGNSDNTGPAVQGGQWGGIVLRQDSDVASRKAFVNSITGADIRYGGGQVMVDAQLESFAPVQIESTRPTVLFNSIRNSAGAGIAATPNSFEDTGDRFGPEFRGNRLTENSINGLFVKIKTEFGTPLDRLDVPARFRSSDIVYVLQENLVISGGVGGYLSTGGSDIARPSGRLTIDPGVVVKLQGSRIELERGPSQLVAEGLPGKSVIFTSLGDNRYGAGGTFDTNGNVPDKFDAGGRPVGTLTTGDWGGIILNAGSKASIDRSYIAFGGGETPIEGAFDNFNVVEVHQADLRLANSRIENNAAGTARSSRTGRGNNAASTVFVRGAQPIIVGNDFRSNAGAVISVNANALSDVQRGDVGRTTGAIGRSTGYDDNFGPLVRGNRLSYPAGGQAVAGMVVRGGEITVESVWDDTDIVHVLQGEIIVQNFHTATGVRLLSKPNASLVVKLAGTDAGFTAAGENLDIDDRIGGTVQIVGQPGYPVVLTSLKDDSAGASLDPLGRLVTDTNADGSATSPSAGDWRSLRFLPFSNDRNVAILTERESAYTGGTDANGSPTSAESLGVLAPNFATGNNTWESAQEKSGDENRRLGFEVHGSVAVDDATDVDVYTFLGSAGSEVWIDIDKTSPALDAMVELLDAAGNVLARSVDGFAEGGVVQGELAINTVGGTTATYQFAPAGLLPGQFSLLPGTLSGVVYDDSFTPIHTFSVNAAGVITFQSILGRDRMGVPNGVTETATGGAVDLANGRLTLDFSGTGLAASFVEVRYSYQTSVLGAAAGIGQTLGKDAWRGGDYFTQNPRDPGMRLILPGTQGVQTRYYLRVRSQPRYEPVATLAANGGVTATTAAQYRTDVSTAAVKNGATSGRYELRVRLRQRDEKPGSTVRYADIRYPTIGIDVQGLPANSPLVADTGEKSTDDNGSFATAQYIGNVLESNRGALSVAGSISSAGDVDWYTFALNYEQLQSIGGVNDGPYSWAAMFDIDYADGFRGDLTISVFDSSGKLIYVGRDSDVADDQPGVSQGTDFDDLSKGSVGKLDPFIGTVNLTAGGPTGSGGGDTGLPPTPPDPSKQLRYYVAISSNERLPTQLNATFGSGAANTLVRLEPIASVDRIATDRIGEPKEPAPGVAATERLIDTAALAAHVTPFTLSDVTLFVMTTTSLVTVDAMRGGVETTLGGAAAAATGDMVMRSDGNLYVYRGVNGSTTTAGQLVQVDSGNGAVTMLGNDDIEDPRILTETNLSSRENPPATVGITTFQLSGSHLRPPQDSPISGTVRLSNPTEVGFDTGDWAFAATPPGAFDAVVPLTITPISVAPGLGSQEPFAGTVDLATGVISITWRDNVIASRVKILDVTYSYTFNDIATDSVDAVAWQRIAVGNYQNLVYSVWDPQRSVSTLYLANSSTGSAALVDGTNLGLQGTLDSVGRTTGMAWLGGKLYGVDTTGQLFTIGGIDDGNFTITTTPIRTITSAGVPISFQGLTVGPQNLEQGLYADLLFGIDSTGKLYCFDAAGSLKTVFDSDGNGTADATSITTGAPGASRGLAFSPLDINLWHMTGRRGGDPGGGGSSMYFGLEAGGAQFGGSAAWQQDLLSNAAIGNNYNLPGGAYGSLTTNPFSLSGYSYTDKPTLYFDYWLQTEGANGGGMRDSARVLASIDGGLTWELVATNNSARSAVDKEDAELPAFPSTSSRMSTTGNQHVQELFDTANWRQARVDLGKFAGESNIRLRFDFHTAGQFDPTQRDAGGNLLNDILGPANTTGNFKSAGRGQNNQFEGFYIDDIIVGFAERGEAVTGATSAATGFFDIGTPGPSDTVAAQVLNGPYQLEIRRGTELGSVLLPDGTVVPETIDTNDRLIGQRSTTGGYGPKLGDANQPREQGQFIVENNIITSAGQYGIRIDAAARDGGSNSPHPGTPRNLPTLNNQRLVAGAVVTNNVVARAGVAGILFSGDPNTGDVPSAAVPFGRIINNTIYGGLIETRTGSTTSTSAVVTVATTVGLQVGMVVAGPGIPANTSVLSITSGTTLTLSKVATATGSGVTLTFREPSALATGVSVTENAGPTLLNNLFANLAQGVSVDASSAGTSVVGTSAYWNTPGASGVSESSAITLVGNPFVNVAGNNFYLAAGTRAIDSSLNALQDRDSFVQVNSPIGIAAAPIIAPERDLYGQLRSDDPGVTNMTGLGSNVFKDRGAIDRVDSVQPFAAIAVPLDGAAADLDADADQVRLEKADARGITTFALQLNDVGVGIDKATVVSGAFELRRNGTLLVAGTDYIFNYLEVSNRVVFEAASVFSMGSYLISVVRTTGGTPSNVVTDLAGNPLLGNQADGTTIFTVELADVPTAPSGLVGVSGDGQVQLSWTASSSEGDPLLGYEVERGTDATFVGATTINVPATDITLTDTPLVNGTSYWFRVRAVNAIGESEWSNVAGPIVPLPIPSFSLAVDTGASNADGITSNGLVNVANVLVGATWEYSIDGAATWSAPQPQTTTTFTLPANATYAAGSVRVRQVVGTSRSSEASNAAAITVDTIAPAAAPVTAVTDDAPLITGPVADGGTTNDAVLVLSGTTEAGTVVEVFSGTTSLGNAMVTGTTWTFTTGTLSDATTYVFKTRATDLAGNIGADSATHTVTIDTTPPAAPTITEVLDDVALFTGPVANGGVTNDTVLVLSGTTDAGTTVEIFNGATKLGNAIVTGTAWTFTTATLTNGTTYAFTARAADSVGNTSSSATHTVTIDTTPPAAPAITGALDDQPLITGNVPSGGTTNDATLVLSGTTAAGTTVEVYSGVTKLGDATVTGTTWSFTTAALAGGTTYSFTAKSTDSAGNTSTSSAAYTVTVDTTPPATPTITSVTDNVPLITGPVASGGLTNDTVLVLAGTTDAGTTVEIFDGAVKLGNATVTGTGWTYTTPTLIDGTTYTFKAVAADAAGNVSTGSATHSVTVDVTKPSAPLISTVTDNVVPVTGDVANGGTTNDTVLVLAGTTENGTVVEIFNGATKVGDATVVGVNWTFTTGTLTHGTTYVFKARAIDTAGNTSVDSSSRTVTVDTVPPATPVITAVTDDVAPNTGAVANGGLTNDALLVLSGTTEAGVTVEIFNGATKLGNATVTGTNWTYATTALSDGTYAFKARATDAAGNASSDSAAYAVTVDATPPAVPLIAGADDNVSPVTGNVANGGTTNDTTPTLAGTAEAGAVITVRRNGTAIGTATANGSGLWTLTTPALASGTHTFTATATDAAGNTSTVSSNYVITVDTVAPAAPAITSVVDDVPLFMGAVPQGGRTNDNELRIVGTAEAGTTVDVRSGATLLGSVTADGSGNWAFTTARLADGSYSLTAIATDTAGNASTASSPAYAFTVDTAAPAVAAIASVTDNFGSIMGTVAPGGRTDDTTLRIAGTAEPGSLVTVRSGNAVLRRVYANSSGSWVIVTDPLAVRLHNLNAFARDEAGNNGAASSFHTVTIDTTAPTILSLGSSTTAGSYGQGAEIAIFARTSERMRAGSAIDVTLNTGAVVRLSTASERSELNGIYRVGPGGLASPLSIVSVANVSPIASDIAGNPVGSLPAVPVVLSGISVDAAIRAFATGFASDPALAPPRNTAVTSIQIVFSTEVTGVSLAALRLFYNERESVSLRDATLTGSGRTYSLTLPANLTNRLGSYRLSIGPSSDIRAVDGNAPMVLESNAYWTRV